MPQEWIGVRELARRVGRRHRAVQHAIEDGRIPAAAVRRNAAGRIVSVEYHAASFAWAARTDPDRALRSAEPLRTPAVAVQTSAPLHAALEVAFLAWPTVLAHCGVAGAQLDAAVPTVLQIYLRELIAYGIAPEQAELERALLVRMLADERAHPETELPTLTTNGENDGAAAT